VERRKARTGQWSMARATPTPRMWARLCMSPTR
jgi:hypothetical protein